jgi:hypothetical protein
MKETIMGRQKGTKETIMKGQKERENNRRSKGTKETIGDKRERKE